MLSAPARSLDAPGRALALLALTDRYTRCAVQTYPAAAPYVGYRADLCALLANLCFGRADLSDALARVGGAELLLSQTRVDEAAPMAREWALWGVRNVCEVSPVAHERLHGLDALHAADDDRELRGRGVRVQLGPDGKPTIHHDSAPSS